MCSSSHVTHLLLIEVGFHDPCFNRLFSTNYIAAFAMWTRIMIWTRKFGTRIYQTQEIGWSDRGDVREQADPSGSILDIWRETMRRIGVEFSKRTCLVALGRDGRVVVVVPWVLSCNNSSIPFIITLVISLLSYSNLRRRHRNIANALIEAMPKGRFMQNLGSPIQLWWRKPNEHRTERSRLFCGERLDCYSRCDIRLVHWPLWMWSMT